jgi:signal transduction histidine kinase
MMHLYPPTLDELSLADAIRDVLSDVSMLDGLKITLCDNLRHPVRGAVKTALYRVVVEALANVRKHAAASAVTIALDEHDEVIDLRVIDDGVGIADGVSSRPNHLGLVTMRDRLLLLGGACRIEPAPGGGTVVRAVVPVGATAPREIDPNPLI